MIDAAKAGFRANGMVATGFTEVLEATGAARGAIYHHFPGGKEELATAVVTSTGDNVEAAIRTLFIGNPADAIANAVHLVASAVEHRDGFGCAIAPAVLEANGSRTILRAADDAFARWQSAIRDGLGSDLGDRIGADTSDIAALVVAAIEGALVLSRAAGSNEPLRRVGRALVAVVDPRPPESRIGEFPTALIRARIARGLTQRELAERVGLAEQAIQRYEASDYAGVSFARLVEIAEALNLTVHDDVRLASTR